MVGDGGRERESGCDGMKGREVEIYAKKASMEDGQKERRLTDLSVGFRGNGAGLFDFMV